MPDHLFASSDDYHYDNSGYYGYVVFNGDERALNGLRNALGQGRQTHGLGWYRYGKSFRPANDGRMYDWYIRLHSGGNEKPAAKAVAAFLKRFLKPAQPAARPEDRTSTQAQLSEDLQRLQTDIARETAAHQEAFGAHQRLDALLGKLGRIDIRFSEDLENLRRDLQDIADTWRADQWSNLNLGSIIRALDEVNLRLTEDLTRLQRDYNDITSAHADTLRAQGELAQVLERLKEHDRHISEDLARLQQDVQRLAERDSLDSDMDSQASLLTRFDDLEQRLGERINKMSEAVAVGTASQAELEDMREALQESQAARAAANAENDSLREIIESKQPSAIEGLNEENRDLKKALRKSREEQKATVSDLRKQLHQQKQEGRKAAENLNYWKQQHEDVAEALQKLKETVDGSDDQKTEFAPADDRVSSDELEEILDGAFPGLRLVRGSMETLHREIQNKRSVMALLHRIVNDRKFNGRNAIRGGKRHTKWREDRFDEEWRAYFCKESSLLGDKVVVLLGDKNNQRQDIEWLVRNPPETCL